MSSEKTLRELAEERGVDVGTAIAPEHLRADRSYWNTARREFTSVTTERALKMGALRPGPRSYDFADADAVVSFARKYDMAVRGHTLVWHTNKPEWFQEWDYTDEQVEEFLREHIYAVAGRYRGKVDAWDVVNEAIHEDGSLRETAWQEAMGEEYIAKAFEWADEVNDADLFYNDYDISLGGEKADAVYDLLEGLLDRGVPVDGVGFQLHAIGKQPDPAGVAAEIERFRGLGLDVHVTELDVAYDLASAPSDPLESQAEYYHDLVAACVKAGCSSITVWGVNDSNSWVRGFHDVENRYTQDPLLFDRKCDPKPAYHAVKRALGRE